MDIVVTSEEKLNQLIENAVKRAVEFVVATPRHAEKMNLNIDEAVLCLNSLGYPVPKSALYKLTHKNEVPFKKFGSTLVFNKEQLIEWAEGNLKGSTKHDPSLIIAQSAKRKMAHSRK